MVTETIKYEKVNENKPNKPQLCAPSLFPREECNMQIANEKMRNNAAEISLSRMINNQFFRLY
tara:strand:- start:1787 stop:1975 length:189 start_codon:yes stop_codon:yes gene_type:complete